MVALDRIDDPFPKAESLGVRIVDPKNLDPLCNPVIDDALEFMPQGAPILGFKIEGVDVLVLFRRVLRVLHAPVGAVLEPLRVGRDIGVVGRTLERDVERDLDAEFTRFGQ